MDQEDTIKQKMRNKEKKLILTIKIHLQVISIKRKIKIKRILKTLTHLLKSLQQEMLSIQINLQ